MTLRTWARYRVRHTSEQRGNFHVAGGGLPVGSDHLEQLECGCYGVVSVVEHVKLDWSQRRWLLCRRGNPFFCSMFEPFRGRSFDGVVILGRKVSCLNTGGVHPLAPECWGLWVGRS